MSQKRIFRPTAAPEDWRGFLAKPDMHWKAGRSAMEAATAWETHAPNLPPEIAFLFPKNCELLLAIPEYKVPLPGGTTESQNDVFALLRNPSGLISLMVEAKRDEPFDRPIKAWRDGSAGKETRLAALCDLLGLTAATVDENLPYQLLHRTASAILTARQFHAQSAAMVVQSFSPESRWFEDFVTFCSTLGHSNVGKNVLITVTLPCGMPLSLGWASAPLRTAAA